jgi:hypothetical protein
MSVESTDGAGNRINTRPIAICTKNGCRSVPLARRPRVYPLEEVTP